MEMEMDMGIIKFELSEHETNDDVLLLGKYQFKARVLLVPAHEAPLVSKLLCNFYGCTMSDVSKNPAKPAAAKTVAKANTKS